MTMKSSLLIRDVLVLISAHMMIMIAAVHSAPLPPRPSAVHFGFVYNMVDVENQNDGVQRYAGLKAAEKEINDAGWLFGTTLSFDYIPGPSNGMSDAASVQLVQNASAGLDGFVLSDWETSQTLYVVAANATNGPLPVVAPNTRTNYEYGPNYSNVLHLRLPPVSQTLMLLHHAFNDEATQFSSFVIVVRPLYQYLIADMQNELLRLNYDPAIVIQLDANSSVLDTGSVIDQWTAPPVPPMCGFFFTPASDIEAILLAMFVDSRFPIWHEVSFFSSIFGSKLKWNHTTFGTAPFANLHFPSGYPDSQSATLPAAVRYRTALASYLATNPTLPADMQVVPISPLANQRSFEGYIAGRFVGEVLQKMFNFTPSGFLSAVYERKFYWVEDLTLGPFVDHCVQDPWVVYPCFCNVGLSSVFVMQVNETTGTPMMAPADDPIEVPQGQLTVTQGKCQIDVTDVHQPLPIAYFASLEDTPSAVMASQAIFQSLRVFAYEANSNGLLVGKFVNVGYYDRIDFPDASASSDNAAVLSQLMAQRKPMVAIGSWFPSVSVPVVNFQLPAQAAYEDPPLAAPTQFSRNSWNFKLTLGDIAHGLVKYLYSLYTPPHGARSATPPRIFVAAETPTALRLTVDSLHTMQFDPEVAQVVNLGSAAAARSAVTQAVAAADGGAQVVFFVSTLSTAQVTNVMQVTGDLLAGRSANDPLFTRLIFAIATGQSSLATLKFTTTNFTALSHLPMYFGSFMLPFWEPGNGPRATLARWLNTNDSMVLEDPALYATYIMTKIIQVSMEDSQLTSADEILKKLYENGQTTVESVVVGPIFDSNCTAEEIASNTKNRRCQCFKAFRTVNVYDYRDWLFNTKQQGPRFSWTMTACGVLYQPLLVSHSVNAALVAGLAAPLGTALIAGLVLFFCLFTGRNNRAAPKDPNTPFAMVFTDIQSSTSLWARAPEVMGEALDQHHSLLRTLVARHGGYEVKTIGDSFMVAFKRASDATAFGLDIQTTLFQASWPPLIDDVYISLAQEQLEEQQMQDEAQKSGTSAPGGTALRQWEDEVTYKLNWNGIRVRVGMHWGFGSIKLDPVSRGYDYYGTVVNTAARVEGVGNGGQVLATKDFFDELEREEFQLRSVDVLPMGPQPLRGLDEPVTLYQLCPEKLRTRQFNALRLDIAVEVEDSESTCISDGKSSLVLNETPDEYLDRLLSRQRDGHSLRPLVVRSLEFLEAAFRVTTPAWRKDTLSALMKKWHVNQHKSRSTDPKEVAQRYASLDMVGLCVRVIIAAEESRRFNADGNSIRSFNNESSSTANGRRGTDSAPADATAPVDRYRRQSQLNLRLASKAQVHDVKSVESDH